MDFSPMRLYLAADPRTSAVDVMKDAVVFQNPGAVILLKFLLEARVNRRTRRSVAEVRTAFALQNPPKWVGVLEKQLFNLYRLSLNLTRQRVP